MEHAYTIQKARVEDPGQIEGNMVSLSDGREEDALLQLLKMKRTLINEVVLGRHKAIF